MIRKDDLLRRIDQPSIIQTYIPFPFKLKKKVRCPFPGEDDKHPSFAFMPSEKTGDILYKKFNDGESGDMVKFVMKMLNCSFKEALADIAQRAGIQEIKEVPNYRIFKNLPTPKVIKDSIIKDYAIKKLSDREISAFIPYGIMKEVLVMYKTEAVSSMSFVTNEGKIVELKSYPDNPIVRWPVDEFGSMRFYRPLANSMKHIADTTADDIFGINIISKPQLYGIIASGQKDVLSLFANTGIYGLSLNSETTHLTPKLWLRIKRKFENPILCYDNDETGIEQTELLMERYGLPTIRLKDVNDIADLFKSLRKQGMPVKARRDYFLQLIDDAKEKNR